MPPIIDLAVVEQVKTLRGMGKNISEISRMLNISRRTAGRYADMEDPPEIAGELAIMRGEMVKKFGEVAWPLMFGFLAELKARLEEGKMSARDLIIGTGVLMDKLNGIEAMAKGANRGGDKITVQFNLYDESKCGVIANPVELPRGELPIQGDDMRPGSGEDLLRLPRIDTDGVPVPEIVGSDSGLDLQEPGGFCPSDDPGRIMGEPGDAGGLGRALQDEQTVDGGDL